ncbi:MAG: hypothetical protein E7110_02845 [Bacteroidales bacterium]|nr:hypothetical protein [Bacteroidales bacterium]
MRKITYTILLLSVIMMGCSTQQKIKKIKKEHLQASVAMSEDSQQMQQLYMADTTTKVEIQNIKGESIIMNAVKDEESGEMVAVEQLNAIVVEAKFRHLAERNGYVDISFDIIVPKEMQDEDWQLRFQPQFRILEDTLNLDELLITGAKYREGQQKGYAQYNKYLETIISDTADFYKTFTKDHLLTVFLERNVNREKSSFFRGSRQKTGTAFGVTEAQAVDYYTRHSLVRKNNKKKEKMDEMFARYVTDPIKLVGVRLDSVINNADGTIRYNYVQPVKTRRNLRKVEMVLKGEIYEAGSYDRIYTMPQTAPLTFYISSMSAFTDQSPRYIQKVVHRNAEANTAANIAFKVGRYDIDDTLSNNSKEIARIKNNIRTVLSAEDYIVDSLLITASCSPEGTVASNAKLAENRAQSIKYYFNRFIQDYRDSVANSMFVIDLTTEGDGKMRQSEIQDIGILTHSHPEEWDTLKELIDKDTSLIDRESILKCLEVEDLDEREKALQQTKDYKYIRSELYAKLRTVKFDFFLHRKGMIKDTVHTTEIDSVYMQGVQALEDRDYESAVKLLRPYMDYNSAVAFVCMDYNQSALSVLTTLPRSAQRDYMLAVVYARLGKEQKAIEHFLQSVEQDYSMRHRGNLDPEVSQLIKKYALDKHLDTI